jgi:hypothetical protein
MPVVKERVPPPPIVHPQAVIGRAVGRCDDFYALAYSPELDEQAKQADPSHRAFTYVLHYQALAKTIVGRLTVRLDDMWQPARGPILSVGVPRGVVQIDAAGLSEVSVPQISEVLTSIWGTDDANVFVGGGAFTPTVVRREQGQWKALRVPDGTTLIQAVRGFANGEVYFACAGGKILIWDGRALSLVQTPTSRDLVSLAPLDDKHMCASGYDGTLLIGNRAGWRLVPTGTDKPLLSIGAFGGKVYFGAEGAVWSFDGRSRPKVAIDTPAVWVNGLADGLVVVSEDDAKLYRAGTLVDLDIVL